MFPICLPLGLFRRLPHMQRLMKRIKFNLCGWVLTDDGEVGLAGVVVEVDDWQVHRRRHGEADRAREVHLIVDRLQRYVRPDP